MGVVSNEDNWASDPALLNAYVFRLCSRMWFQRQAFLAAARARDLELARAFGWKL